MSEVPTQQKRRSKRVGNGSLILAISLFWIGGLTTGGCQGTSSGQGSYQDITVQELQQQMPLEDAVLLDVRTPGEVEDGTLPGAMIIDFFSDSFDSELDALDREKPVYVYCHSGGRSSEAADKLVAMGFKQVYNIDGGYASWKRANLPIEVPE